MTKILTNLITHFIRPSSFFDGFFVLLVSKDLLVQMTTNYRKYDIIEQTF